MRLIKGSSNLSHDHSLLSFTDLQKIYEAQVLTLQREEKVQFYPSLSYDSQYIHTV